jgi:hypothetical protein
MSLRKTLALASRQGVDERKFRNAGKVEGLLDGNDNLIEMAPAAITADELTIEINGVKAKIVGINKTTEYARGIRLYGYNVQVLKPEHAARPELKYDRISITLRSTETGESGKGETFVERLDGGKKI